LKRLALLAMLLVACTRGADTKADTAADRTTDMATDTTAVMSTRTSAGVSAGEPVCLGTGLWSSCAIFERLDRQGLAPIRDSSVVATEPPLHAKGLLLRLGRGELEVYIYGSASERERDAARLDRTKYVVYPAPLPLSPVPTLVISANLIAILHSRNDHLRERVSDAITAGPPQPSPIRP
jgi:hypothetical protein